LPSLAVNYANVDFIFISAANVMPTGEYLSLIFATIMNGASPQAAAVAREIRNVVIVKSIATEQR